MPSVTTLISSKNESIAVIIVVVITPVRLLVVGVCLYFEHSTSTTIANAISINVLNLLIDNAYLMCPQYMQNLLSDSLYLPQLLHCHAVFSVVKLC